MQPYWRFNIVCASATLMGLSMIGLFNLVVDPYGAIGAPTFSGLNQDKPIKRSNVRFFKAFESARRDHRAIFLGTSQVDRGLDPSHPALSDYQPAYNLGLPGANTYEQQRYLEHVLINQKDLEVVIIGLDLFAFNANNEGGSDFDNERMGKPGLYVGDLLNATLSLDALMSSYKTLRSNIADANPPASYLENGMLSEEYYRARNEELFKDDKQSMRKVFEEYLSRHLSNDIYLHNYILSQERLDNLKKIVELCDRHDVELKVFISPAHATYLEAIYVGGLWSIFEEWKRQIVKITPVWDFSGYNSVTTEPITNEMNNYYDAVHYSKDVGDLVLSRLMADTESTVPDDFGVLLNAGNIEEHLTQTLAEREAWANRNPEVAEFVRSLK